MKPGRSDTRNRPLYMIGVAARLAGMHPQTLRIYERKELVSPQRTSGNTRLYSESDIDQLRIIQQMTAEGVNLAGVVRILELMEAMEKVRAEAEVLKFALQSKERELARHARNKSTECRTELVMVRRGGLVRREGGK